MTLVELSQNVTVYRLWPMRSIVSSSYMHISVVEMRESAREREGEDCGSLPGIRQVCFDELNW